MRGEIPDRLRILVTGGTGFIGSNLALELLAQGHEVSITGHDAEQKVPGLTGKYLQPSFQGLDWNAIGGVDVVFHQAAINDTTLLDEGEMLRANFSSSQRLFEHAARNGCKRIVYASSTAVYGDVPAPYRESGPVNPLNPYARSKLLLDSWARCFAKEHPDVVVVGLRYCNVYGPRENHKGKRASMIYQLAQQIARGNPRVFKYGEQKRDYIYVKDVVRANLLALHAQESRIYNCGLGGATSFNDVIWILSRVLGVMRETEYFDNPYAAAYQSHTECDMTLAEEQLGFVPEFDIERGVLDYYRSGFLV